MTKPLELICTSIGFLLQTYSRFHGMSWCQSREHLDRSSWITLRWFDDTLISFVSLRGPASSFGMVSSTSSTSVVLSAEWSHVQDQSIDFVGEFATVDEKILLKASWCSCFEVDPISGRTVVCRRRCKTQRTFSLPRLRTLSAQPSSKDPVTLYQRLRGKGSVWQRDWLMSQPILHTPVAPICG